MIPQLFFFKSIIFYLMFDYDLKNQFLKDISTKTISCASPFQVLFRAITNFPTSDCAGRANESAVRWNQRQDKRFPQIHHQRQTCWRNGSATCLIRTFDKELQGRCSRYTYTNKKNVKIESEYFNVQNFRRKAEEHLNRINELGSQKTSGQDSSSAPIQILPGVIRQVH